MGGGKVSDKKIASVRGLRSALDSYVEQSNVPALTAADARLAILKEFEENDKRRGSAYLAHTPVADDSVRIQYKEHVEFVEDESPLIEGMFSADFLDGPITVSPPEIPEIAFVPEEELPEDFTDEEDEWADSEETIAESVDVELEHDTQTGAIKPSPVFDEFDLEDETSSGELSEPDPVIEVVKSPGQSNSRIRPKKPNNTVSRKPVPKTKPSSHAPRNTEKKTQSDIFDEFDSMLDGPSKKKSTPRPEKNQQRVSRPKRQIVASTAPETYRTVRELVKANPNCTVDFAKGYFPDSEIKKQITMGRVYVKNGKLSI